MRRLAVVLGLLLVGLPGVSLALDRQGMAVISGGAGAGFLGGAPTLMADRATSDARARLSLRGGTRGGGRRSRACFGSPGWSSSVRGRSGASCGGHSGLRSSLRHCWRG